VFSWSASKKTRLPKNQPAEQGKRIICLQILL
jgi:hypothetical protein